MTRYRLVQRLRRTYSANVSASVQKSTRAIDCEGGCGLTYAESFGSEVQVEGETEWHCYGCQHKHS